MPRRFGARHHREIAESNDLSEIERIEDAADYVWRPKRASTARSRKRYEGQESGGGFWGRADRALRGVRHCRDTRARDEVKKDGKKGSERGRWSRGEETEGGETEHRITSTEPIFGSAKCKQNDRPVMHRRIRRKSSDRTRGGPIPVVATHARIISAARGAVRGIFITSDSPDWNKCCAKLPYRPHVRPKMHYDDSSRREIVFRCRRNRSCQYRE